MVSSRSAAGTQGPVALTREQELELLEGLPPSCWAAYVLLNKQVKTAEGYTVDGTVWLPPGPKTDPVLHDVIALDLGKAQFKSGGVNDRSHFRHNIIVDAYCTARAVQHEAKSRERTAKGMTTWRLLSEQGRTIQHPKGCWIGTDALEFADKLPLAEITVRIRESRFREMFYAAVVGQLGAMGRTPIEGNRTKPHYGSSAL